MRLRNLFNPRTVCWLAAAAATFFGGFYIGRGVEERRLRSLLSATELSIDSTERTIENMHQILGIERASRGRLAEAADGDRHR